MKNTTKALLACGIVLCGVSVFAGHHDHGGPPSGVRLASDIVGLVGRSLDILRGPVVYTQPATQVVYTDCCPAEEVVYTTAPAVRSTVVYTTPRPAVYYYNYGPAIRYRPLPPPPPRRGPHHPGPGHHRAGPGHGHGHR